METVTHDGRATAYRQPGGGDVGVLYVHGSGATHRVWVHQYGRSGVTAVAVDLSGHGRSDDLPADPEPEAALEAYGNDVLAVARETGARVLAGNSLGGAVVLWIALEREFNLAGLVLCGTGAKLSVRPDLLEWLSSDFEQAVEELHRPGLLFHDIDQEDAKRSAETMRATGAEVTQRDFQVCDAFDVRGRLEEVDAPALAVCGEHDGLTPPAYHEYLAEHIPDCEFVEVPDAAHLPMLERPQAFNEAVEGFLARIL